MAEELFTFDCDYCKYRVVTGNFAINATLCVRCGKGHMVRKKKKNS